MELVFNTIPSGIMNLLKTGLQAKYNLNYSGESFLFDQSAGASVYKSKDGSIILFVFDGGATGLSEYALVKNAQEGEADVAIEDYAGKYGDLLSNFISPTKIGFQKQAVGDEWGSLGVGFSEFAYIPSTRVMSIYGLEAGWVWNDERFDIALHAFAHSISVSSENETLAYPLPQLALSPILGAQASKIYCLFEIAGTVDADVDSIDVELSNNGGESQVISIVNGQWVSGVTLQYISRVRITINYAKGGYSNIYVNASINLKCFKLGV